MRNVWCSLTNQIADILYDDDMYALDILHFENAYRDCNSFLLLMNLHLAYIQYHKMDRIDSYHSFGHSLCSQETKSKKDVGHF